MDELDELDQLQNEAKALQQQLKGMDTAEMDFAQANEAMLEFVKTQEVKDDLVSGDGMGWKEITNVIVTERVEVVEEKKCCVIA